MNKRERDLYDAGNELADELEQLNDGLMDAITERRIKNLLKAWDKAAGHV